MDTQPDPQRMTSEERKAWREAFFASLRDRPRAEQEASSRLAQKIWEDGQEHKRRTIREARERLDALKSALRVHGARLISAPLASGRDDSARTSGPAFPSLAPSE